MPRQYHYDTCNRRSAKDISFELEVDFMENVAGPKNYNISQYKILSIFWSAFLNRIIMNT